MLWIGLTGGIASGKSTTSEILRRRGYGVVDADTLAREVVRPGTDALKDIVSVFGTKVLQPDGTLDRKTLGQIVFANPAKRAQLESITHPRIRELALRRRAEIATTGAALAFYDVPLLFEQNLQGSFDLTVAVVCEPRTQLQRLRARDGLSEEAAEQRLAAQLPIGEKMRLADEVIRNDAGPAELEAEIDAFLARVSRRS